MPATLAGQVGVTVPASGTIKFTSAQVAGLGFAAGDTMLVAIHSYGTNAAITPGIAGTPDATWTQKFQARQGTNPEVTILTRPAAGGEGSGSNAYSDTNGLQFQSSVTNSNQEAHLLRLSGAGALATANFAASTNLSGENVTTPAVATGVTGDLVLRFIAVRWLTAATLTVPWALWSSPAAEQLATKQGGQPQAMSLAKAAQGQDGTTGTRDVQINSTGFTGGVPNGSAVAYDTAIAVTINVPVSTSPPVNSTPPQLSGAGLGFGGVSNHALRGVAITASSGSWDQTGLTFAFKYQASDDGVTGWTDIAGATSANFTPTSTQQAKYIRADVTATNTNGQSTHAQTSAYLVVPPVPTPISGQGPSISGSGQVGQPHILSLGNWNESPGSYSPQWHVDTGSGAQDISGATGSSWTPTIPGTYGARVVAHNAGGDSTPVETNTIVVTTGLQASDIKVGLTGGSTNTNNLNSLGGARSTSEPDIPSARNALLPDITSIQAAAGWNDYVAIAVFNSNATKAWLGVKAFVSALSTSTDDEILIGLDPAATGPGETIANNTTAPAGVALSTPTTLLAGLAVGDMAPLTYRVIWISRRVLAGAAQSDPDTSQITFSGTDSLGNPVSVSLAIIYAIAPPTQMGFGYLDGNAGLVGTIGMMVKNLDNGVVVVPWSTGGISEDAPGYYLASRAMIQAPGNYAIFWSTSFPLTAGNFAASSFEVKNIIEQALNLTIDQLQAAILATPLDNFSVVPGGLAEHLIANLDAPVSERATPQDVINSVVAVS
jgi:hypothetical protein